MKCPVFSTLLKGNMWTATEPPSQERLHVFQTIVTHTLHISKKENKYIIIENLKFQLKISILTICNCFQNCLYKNKHYSVNCIIFSIYKFIKSMYNILPDVHITNNADKGTSILVRCVPVMPTHSSLICGLRKSNVNFSGMIWLLLGFLNILHFSTYDTDIKTYI